MAFIIKFHLLILIYAFSAGCSKENIAMNPIEFKSCRNNKSIILNIRKNERKNKFSNDFEKDLLDFCYLSLKQGNTEYIQIVKKSASYQFVVFNVLNKYKPHDFLVKKTTQLSISLNKRSKIKNRTFVFLFNDKYMANKQVHGMAVSLKDNDDWYILLNLTSINRKRKRVCGIGGNCGAFELLVLHEVYHYLYSKNIKGLPPTYQEAIVEYLAAKNMFEGMEIHYVNFLISEKGWTNKKVDKKYFDNLFRYIEKEDKRLKNFQEQHKFSSHLGYDLGNLFFLMEYDGILKTNDIFRFILTRDKENFFDFDTLFKKYHVKEFKTYLY